MAFDGPNTAGTIAENLLSGGSGWANIPNAGASDNAYAVSSISGGGVPANQRTCELLFSNFGLTVPDGATVVGVKAEIERKVSLALGSPQDFLVQLTLAGTPIGEDKAQAVNWTTSDVVAEYGGESDLWTAELDPADVPDLGIVFRGHVSQAIGFKDTVNLFVDCAWLTVFYTEGGGGGAVVRRHDRRRLRAG